MRTFDVQSIQIDAPYDTAFEYIANPAALPEWTHAFASVRGRHAVMRTPAGEVDVDLDVRASREHGTIDWTMTFPGGDRATAWSRVVRHRSSVIYTFVLQAPPVPLEQLEGTLRDQSQILSRELEALARRLGQPQARA
jgi:hypothetical protein